MTARTRSASGRQKVRARYGLCRTVLELAKAAGTVSSVDVSAELRIPIAQTSSKLSLYCRRGLLELAGGNGRQHSPYLYQITEEGCRMLAGGAGLDAEAVVARRGPDFGPLVAALGECGPRVVAMALDE